MFVWWEKLAENLQKVYKHRRVVFGVNCGPFLLGAVLNRRLDESAPAFKPVSESLKQSFYVDNCATSVDSEEELVLFIEQATKLLAEEKFDLRGW